MFKVKGEKLVRAMSASTTQSRSGKQTTTSKRKQGSKQANTPLIIVPESINEDDALMVISENVSISSFFFSNYSYLFFTTIKNGL